MFSFSYLTYHVAHDAGWWIDVGAGHIVFCHTFLNKLWIRDIKEGLAGNRFQQNGDTNQKDVNKVTHDWVWQTIEKFPVNGVNIATSTHFCFFLKSKTSHRFHTALHCGLNHFPLLTLWTQVFTRLTQGNAMEGHLRHAQNVCIHIVIFIIFSTKVFKS